MRATSHLRLQAIQKWPQMRHLTVVMGARRHLQGQSVVEVGNVVPVEFPGAPSIFGSQERKSSRWLSDVSARFDDLAVQRLHIAVVAIHTGYATDG
jgi:hypothetical protein